MIRRTVFTTVAAFTSLSAFAQAPAPPASDELPLATAVEWAQAAIAACEANSYKVAVLVMGTDYGIKLVLRADGAPGLYADVARRKAYTVLKTGKTSGEYGASVAPPAGTPAAPPVPGAPPGLPPGPNVDSNLIVWAGGLPIKAGGKLVGSVGVSGAPGGDKDTACAEAGLAKIAAKLK